MRKDLGGENHYIDFVNNHVLPSVSNCGSITCLSSSLPTEDITNGYILKILTSNLFSPSEHHVLPIILVNVSSFS